ncbi:glycosyltransferase family 2 protein, partial [Bacillus cereus]|nr:glycosyltransferase family 2 protein [Bacillus cereus]MEC2664936.1 glycosyltransferase family 2 protein [Bacillus cereus]
CNAPPLLLTIPNKKILLHPREFLIGFLLIIPNYFQHCYLIKDGSNVKFFNAEKSITFSYLDQFLDGPPIYPNLSNYTILPEGKVFIYHHNYFIMTDSTLHLIDKDILQKLYLLKNCIPISKINLSYFKI